MTQRVLIVDDRPENLYLLRQILEANGFAVEEASNGAEALSRARSRPPDAVISDLLMPVMDGYTLLGHWRADVQLNAIPFIVYTATFTGERDRKLALEIGADAVLVKPIEPDVLVTKIRGLLASGPDERPHANGNRVIEDPTVMRKYNRALVRKLEEKAFELNDLKRNVLVEGQSFVPQFTAAARVLAISVAAVGLVVLLGWALDVTLLKSVIPGAVSMKANTAVCFTLVGAAIYLLVGADSKTSIRRIAAGLSGAAGLIAAASLAEIVSGVDLRIDQLLFNDLAAGGLSPGRMSPLTAAFFIALSASSVLIALRPVYWLSQAFSVVTAAGSLGAVVGYFVDAQFLYGALPGTTPIAVHTAFAMLMLSAAVLFAGPKQGLMALLTNHDAGGQMLRRLFPAAVASIVLVAGVRVAGARYGLFDVSLGIAMMTVGSILVVGALIAWNAQTLYLVDQKRRLSEARNRRLAAVVDSSYDAIVGIGLDGTITSWNRGAEELYGYTATQVVGRPFAILVPPDRQDEPRRFHASALLNKTSDRYETQRLAKNGDVREVSVTVSPVLDNDGMVVGLSSTARDISARKQIEREMQQQAKSLERSNDELTRFNRAAVGREIRIIELKKQINELCTEIGRHEPYPLDFVDARAAELIGLPRDRDGKGKGDL